jgi:imidazolonepropionase-like amidohydrolase
VVSCIWYILDAMSWFASRLCLLAPILVFGFAASAQSAKLAIEDVNVVDVIRGRILPSRTVAIENGKIVSVGAKSAAPKGARRVNGRGKFLVPGLWDMHAHTELAGELSLQLALANGVTTIRDMGSDLDLILRLRSDVSAGRILGPRIFAAGPILDDAPGDWPFRIRVKTAADGAAAVRELKRRGVDLIKVHDHTPPEAFRAIAAEAQRQGLPVAGHIPLGLTVEQVVEAGQGDIEHLSNLSLWETCSGGDEYKPANCRALLAMLARKRIWQTPTLVFWREAATIGTPASKADPARLVYVGRSQRAFWNGNQRFFTPQIASEFARRVGPGAVMARDMDLAGVGVLAGCDGLVAGFCLHDELAAFVKGGMTPAAALRTATINPARYFGRDSALGSVTPGKLADLLLLDENPLDDIANTTKIRAVIANGRLMDRAELDGLLERVKTAANAQ